MTIRERTGWRDETISARHREWGAPCPMVDIDSIWIEYGYGDGGPEPLALIEYKHECAHPASFNTTQSTIQAIKKLADRAGTLFFIVEYGRDCTWFRVYPVNGEAKRIFRRLRMRKDEFLTEYRYVVEFLYGLRSRKCVDDEVLKILSREIGKPGLPGRYAKRRGR